MIKVSQFLFLLLTFIQAGEISWSNIRQQAREHMVEIEYYEKLNSTDDLQNDSKRKKHLAGILVNDSGLILTSNTIFRAGMDFTNSSHFTPPDPPSDIRVRFQDGPWKKAGFVGKDDDVGLAFIKLKNKPLHKSIKFSKDTFDVGTKTIIVRMLNGNYQNRFLIQERIINSVLKTHNPKYLTELNANSTYGFGLVFDMRLRPVAIVRPSSAGFSFDRNFKKANGGLAEFLPAVSLMALIKKPPTFAHKKPTSKKWFGINMQPVTPALARYFGSPDSSGILINTVLKKSPAKRAGLKAGDIILRFAGHKLQAEKTSDLEVFRNLVRDYDLDKAPVVYWRSGKTYHISMQLTDIPISQYLANEVSDYWLGFRAKELTKDIILSQKLDFNVKGLWISRVERAGAADLAGLHIGDILLKINNQDLIELDQLKEELTRLKEEQATYVRLFVRQGPETKFIFINTKPETSSKKER